MKRFAKKILALTVGLVAIGWLVYQPGQNKKTPLASLQPVGKPHVRSSFSAENRDDALARHEFEMRRLRDPQTGRIPDDIRGRELDFARHLPTRESLQKNGAAKLFAADWARRGPVNVGGRTRALAIDLNYNGASNRRILAGGVSGGMFLSTDDGATWQMTTTLAQFPSATCLVQDPNNRNTWYYGTGELLGSTRAGGSLSIPGQGIFKSTDNGVTWSQLPATRHASATGFDGPFDFVWNLAIRPQSNAIFAATLGSILRSTDGGNNWTFVLVGQDANNNLSVFSDVVVASNGDVYAALSRNGIGLNNQQFGVFRSTNNGDQFTVISPPGLVADPNRMVLATAPSDPNTLYLLVQANQAGAVASDHQFFRYNAATNSWTNLSASLPDEQGLSGNASFSSQGGYDLLVKVKPDNANTVWIGGTNLYRSTNAGQSFTRVGGYLAADTYGQFENHHSDQHALVFFPNNPNALLSGNDGGLTKAADALAQPQTWTSLNNGYVATQFYAVALDPQAGSNFITGGTQDNGTWGTDVANFNTPWASLFSGDGAYTDIVAGGNTFYVSAQKGFVQRMRRSNNQLLYTLVQPVTPNGDRDFLFIAPFQLDPNNPAVMYLAVGNGVYRNSDLDGITVVDNQDPITTNWSTLSNSAVSNMQVTTLAVSKTPANRLYFGATDYQSNTAIVRVDNAPANPAGTDITPAGVAGAYPACIGVNPNNTDEIIAVFSNYRIPSLWYSNNGGGSWTNIEGNLAGDEGPSIRWATIVPTNNGRTYLLATSTGIYSTTTLSGANTAWVQEGATPIGNVVVDMIVARPSDGVVVAGTHGRGVYSSQLAGVGGTASLNVNVTELNIALRPGTTRSVQFNLGNTGTAALDYNITATGPTANGVISPRTNFESDFSSSVPKFNFAAIAAAHGPASRAGESSPPTSTLTLGNFADDALVYDDGNNTADDYTGLGANSGNNFYWLNTYTPSGFGFRLEAFDFYMRTESASANPVSVAVFDANGNTLAQGNLTLATARNGSFYNITVNPNLSFNDGQGFAIAIGASRVIPFPAGADVDAAVPNRSFYLNPNTNQYVNLNSISGFENGAFIIRARGTKTGLPNQPPIARGTISKTQATVNETLTFDASQSSDPDGQITQYRWEFGDGSANNQSVTTHAYSQAGTYTVKLIVTDNQGATGDAQGQVTITGAPNQSPIARATLSKTQARVNESISFDASTSSDPDGQITQYLWNFGDGTTSNQRTTAHAYAQAGNFTYTLTVTDNGGATGQTSGQVTITATPTRLTVNPANGTVVPNGSQTITVNFDAQGLAEGNYQGQLNITSNGGNRNLPVRITVSNSVKVDEPRSELPRAFLLEQNYPNPFRSEATSRFAGNPETTIQYSLPASGEVYLRIYNLYGELVTTLVAGAQVAGEHVVFWDGRNRLGDRVASGIYLYRLETVSAAGVTNLTRKLTIMK